MPTMPQEQIDEMEHTMTDLLDQLEAERKKNLELRQDNEALRIALNQARIE